MQEAVHTADPDLATDTYKRAETARACAGAALDLLGRNAAFAFYARAKASGVPASKATALLTRALTFGRPWQILAAVADLEKTAKRYDKAAPLYQEALDDIRDETFNRQAPNPDVIAKLIKKAEATRLLAPNYVARRGLRGEPAGLACPSFRGFEVRRSALPIEFEYKEPGFKKQGAEALTPKGRAAAEDLYDFLTRQGAPNIHLVGHTDPIGGDDYNQALSERRSAAIKVYLVGKGYKGEIRTSGKGRREPFDPDDPTAFIEAERHQLDRRVVLDRLGKLGTSCGS